ncbi:MAG: FadR/GntR family transcriptional regulator [Thermoleophilaceae bacterium]
MAERARRKAVQLEPARPMPLKDQVLRQLKRLIDDGGLRPGDHLPSERALAEQLQVSRGTVREAVQFLGALGLVEIRHGSGAYVRRSTKDREGLRAEWRRWTWRHAVRVHDLLEVRRALEALAAELAAGRGEERSLEEMAEAIERMREADGDVAALVQADVSFHHALSEASGNAALVELADALGAQLLQERAAAFDLPGRPGRSVSEHLAIYDAVRSGNASRSASSVLAHLASVEHDIEGFLGFSGAPLHSTGTAISGENDGR